MEKKKITSYQDLDVYQRSYNVSLVVVKEILPRLPEYERFDLKNQLLRSCKAVPRLIAEGFAKKHQKAGFQKYLDDAMAEANETQVGLCQCKDIYPDFVNKHLCEDAIKEYEVIGKQLYRLEESWNNFYKRPKTAD